MLLCSEPETRLGWLGPVDIERLEIDVPPVFLGQNDGVAHFAIDISQLGDPPHELDLDQAWRFEEARAAATQLSSAETGILAQSRAQIDWHRRHQFCSVCGQRTVQSRGGHVRQCSGCKAEHFPVPTRLPSWSYPTVLGACWARVAGGCREPDRIRRWRSSSKGESIEEAVRREVKEEAGIQVGQVRAMSRPCFPAS